METSGIPVPELPRNTFDLIKKRVGSMRAGIIYPIYSKYMRPNENLSVQIETVVRRLPTIAPSFAEDRVIYRAFKVPIRTLWKDFPSWLQGIKEYSDDIIYEGDVPRWTPSDISKTGPSSLWRMLGYPVNCLPTIPPADFKRQAYAWIRDCYFRYRPVQDTVLEEGKPGTWTGEDMFIINKDRDFFTTGLTQQQVGMPISLPITGDSQAVWEGGKDQLYSRVLDWALDQNVTNPSDNFVRTGGTGSELKFSKQIGDHSVEPYYDSLDLNKSRFLMSTELQNRLNQNTVSLTNISSATIDMIRTAFARQLDAEQMARVGAFYPAVLQLNWGTAPSDDILGYPEYVGGCTVNLVNSEVLQTAPSSNETPLGEMGGHGLGIGGSESINVSANEHTVFMIVAYIKSENFYGGQGMPIEDMFLSREDMGFLAYQHLSEQKVMKQALLCISAKYPYWDATQNKRMWGDEDPTAKDYNEDTLFFMPMYQYMREDTNDVYGLMVKEILYTNAQGTGNLKEINNLYNWTQAQFFSIKDGERPAFNEDFIEYKDDMRNYAVQYRDIDGKIQEDQYIVWNNFHIESAQVLDKYGMPGYTDHIGRLGA